jgi:hypothetical protein
MNESRKTLYFVVTAAVLVVLAFLAAPKRITPEMFSDQGQAFFPKFTDPNQATSLEVVGFDATTGSAKPFKVQFKNGRWTIPSHHDYPADAKDRLAKTGAGVMDIKRDDVRSDNVADHAACGVIDPMDQATTGLNGRGTRVTLKDKDENVLADFIVGNQVQGKAGERFVRVPGQKRVYAVKMNVDLSSRFEDWIEKDLLQVTRADINRVVLKDYSINERTASVDRRDNLMLNLKSGVWKANNLGADQVVDSAKMQGLLTAIDELQLEGVRPKPEGLSRTLQGVAGGGQITQSDVMSLQTKGFFLSREGQLLSNEGELQVGTDLGVLYTLRFGEVVHGSGLAITAGLDGNQEDQGGPADNRYLFVTAEFDPSTIEEPAKPRDESFKGKPDSLLTDADRTNRALSDAHDKWQRDMSQGRKKVEELNARFADWYYVISAASFEKLHLSRKDMVVKKQEKKEEKKEEKKG